jgi:hypothetical protein
MLERVKQLSTVGLLECVNACLRREASWLLWVMTPYNLVEVHGCFGGMYCHHIQDRRVNKGFICLLRGGCLVYSSVLKMEAVYSPETSMKFYQTTRHHKPHIVLNIVTDVRT